MTSQYCKGEEHDGCPTHGRMRTASGKVFKCDCKCHPIPEVKKHTDEEDDIYGEDWDE